VRGVGLADAFRSWLGPRPSESDLEGQIAWQGAERRLGIGDYLGIPAVARARQLIVSLVSMLEPVAWRGGYPIDDQPAILRRPSPEITRTEYLSALAGSLVDHGNAYLWQPITGRDPSSGRPDVSIVLPFDDVRVEWADESKLSRKYGWAGRELRPGSEIVHVAIDRPAGELLGRSPLDTNAEALGRVLIADLFASDWFESGAVPSITLKHDGTLTDAQAEKVRAKWIETHRDHSPAVLPKGWDTKESSVSPESSQLLETRKWGVQEVARVFGIFPAELLLAELNGSSLTYQNVAEALSTFVRVTVQPVYLNPIEEALSDLVAGTQTVRFSLAELERLGTAARFTTYETGLRAGFLTTEQIDRWEGWNRAAPPPTPPAYVATPAPPPAPEVAANA
jgi:HK97 family phage portal protein